MEKRLLLAVFLSILVVFIFQLIWQPPIPKDLSSTTQSIEKQTVKADILQNSKKSDTENSDLSVKSIVERISVLSSEDLRIEFTNKGANVRSVEVKDMQYVMPVTHYCSVTFVDNEEFQVMSQNEREIIYRFEQFPWVIEKKYDIQAKRLFSCELSIKNIGVDEQSLDLSLLNFVINTNLMDEDIKKADWTLFEYNIKTNNKFIRKNNVINFNDKWNENKDLLLEWAGFRDRYFAAIIKPKFNVNNYFVQTVSTEKLAIGVKGLKINLLPQQKQSFEWVVYVGPQRLEDLKMANSGFEQIIVFSNWGWLDAIAKVIYWLLGIIYKIIPIWGLCIILVSFLIYIAMYPLTIQSLMSMKKMQSLQPRIKNLQEKYNKNPEKINQEIMELYRQNGVNPLGGCLPMILQMPIFYGLYQVLWRSIYFKGEKFLWIHDLSLPDRLCKLPVNIPFIGEYFNILPILMMGIMVLQQYFSSKNIIITDEQQATQQKMMMILFPIFIGIIFYNFASGLNLYFIVFYLLSALTQWKIAHDDKANTPDGVVA